MDERMFRRTSETIFSEIGGDVIALNIPSGRCYGMQEVAATVWSLLEQPAAVSRICELLEAQYQVDPRTCREDVEQLFAAFRREGLIELVPGSA